MKKQLFILLLIPVYSLIYGQQPIDEIKNQDTQSEELPVKKLDYSFQTGSMFYGCSIKGNTFYFAPEFSYKFSPKFKFTGGVMLMNNNYTFSSANFLNEQGNTRLFSQPSKYQAVVYGQGDYKFNNRLTLTGSFIKNFNDQPNSALQNRAYNNSFQMMSMGLNYKLSENVTIGAGFRFMQTDGYNYNPLLYNTSPVYTDYFNNY